MSREPVIGGWKAGRQVAFLRSFFGMDGPMQKAVASQYKMRHDQGDKTYVSKQKDGTRLLTFDQFYDIGALYKEYARDILEWLVDEWEVPFVVVERPSGEQGVGDLARAMAGNSQTDAEWYAAYLQAAADGHFTREELDDLIAIADQRARGSHDFAAQLRAMQPGPVKAVR